MEINDNKSIVNIDLKPENLNLELIERIKLFGNYENYLKKQLIEKEINDDFVEEPNLKDDEYFKIFISQLDSSVITKV